MTKCNLLEMGFMSACSLKGHHLAKPKWELQHGRKLETGADEEALGNTAYWPALHDCILLTPRTPCPGVVPLTMDGLGPPAPVSNQEKALAKILTDQAHAGNSSSYISPSYSSLFPVKLTNTT